MCVICLANSFSFWAHLVIFQVVNSVVSPTHRLYSSFIFTTLGTAIISIFYESWLVLVKSRGRLFFYKKPTWFPFNCPIKYSFLLYVTAHLQTFLEPTLQISYWKYFLGLLTSKFPNEPNNEQQIIKFRKEWNMPVIFFVFMI